MKIHHIILLFLLLGSCNGKPSKSSSEKEFIQNVDNIETENSQAEDLIENEVDSEKETAYSIVEYFFKTYMKDLANNPGDNTVREMLREKYLAPEFKTSLAQMEESEIDCIVDSHGFDENWIKSLRIEQSLHAHKLFSVSYSTETNWINLIVWLAEDETGNYLIHNIHPK